MSYPVPSCGSWEIDLSSNEVDSWLSRWHDVATRVRANEALARDLVKAARVNVRRAQRALKDGDLDAAVIWAEAAVLNGADAVMQQLPKPSGGLQAELASHPSR